MYFELALAAECEGRVIGLDAAEKASSLGHGLAAVEVSSSLCWSAVVAVLRVVLLHVGSASAVLHGHLRRAALLVVCQALLLHLLDILARDRPRENLLFVY